VNAATLNASRRKVNDKHIFPTFVFCIALTLFAGCGGVSASSGSQQTPTPTPTPSSPTPTPTPSASASHFIYGITVFETDTGYQGGSINSNTGQITPIATLPFASAGLGQNIVVQLISDPKTHFLYALNVGTGHAGEVNSPGIVELQINSQTGELTPIPGGPLVFQGLGRDGQLAIDHSGQFLYQPNAGAFDIYGINQSSGALTKLSSSTAASLGEFTAISPDGHFLFNAGDTSVESLSIDTGGNLTVVQSPIPTGGSAVGINGQVTVSPDNQFLYVLNQGSVAIFKIGSTGTLAPVVGSPFATDPGATGLSLAPDGRHLYIAFSNGGINTVKGFTFDATASTFTSIANAAITDNALTVTVDASGRFAYVTENRMLSTYSIDPTTGGLTKLSQTTQPVSQSSASMIAVP
jgi:6-phosphogluconolactonase (cycloisomerase 2 family)